MRDSAETKLKSPHIPLIKFKDSPAHKRWHSQVTTKAATPNQLNYNTEDPSTYIKPVFAVIKEVYVYIQGLSENNEFREQKLQVHLTHITSCH